MANCIFCNKPAGFLRKKHKECLQKYNKAKTDIINTVKLSLKENKELNDLKKTIYDLANNNYIKENEVPQIAYSGWSQAIEDAFDDGVITNEEENKLVNIIQNIGFKIDELKGTPEYYKLAKGAVLRDLMEGSIPERVNISGEIPINLQKDEKIIWAFPNSEYLEEKTRTQYVGSSTGYSLRVAKGLYIRQSAFKGNPIKVSEIVSIDIGNVVITNKHIYFYGSRKSFRVKYDKIVSYQPYSDALGIMRDAQNAKPQIFKVDDPWFIYNLVINLSKL